jgi:hypothetical protein
MMELGNLTEHQAVLARDAAALALAPPLIPLHELLISQTARPQLRSGLPAIDEAMKGGFLNGSITELVGPAGEWNPCCRSKIGVPSRLWERHLIKSEELQFLHHVCCAQV